MEIQLKKNSTTPLYKQIRNTIRSQILSGQLSDGFKLPSERQLVEKLGVHRNTVKKAYEMLIQGTQGIFCEKQPFRGKTRRQTGYKESIFFSGQEF